MKESRWGLAWECTEQLILARTNGTYIMAPPYLGAPKFAKAISKPPGNLDLASGGKVICRSSVRLKCKLPHMCVP